MFTLYRYLDDGIQTYGLLFYNGEWIADTLELPWKDNKLDISCIPEGIYALSQFESPHNGTCVAVEGVQGRSEIEIHAANFVSQLKGCIAVGVKSKEDVVLSRNKLSVVYNSVEPDSMLEVKKL